MRIARNQDEQEEAINLMPLIDMVFLLLIFFLVATTIASEEREINMQLPVTAAAQPLSAPPKQLIVNVLKDGSIKIAGMVYSQDQLGGVLSGLVASDPTREVLIRADEQSIHRYFANVASECRKVGVNELKIGYLFSDPK